MTRWYRTLAPALLIATCVFAAPADADPAFIIDQLVVGVSATPDGAGEHVATVHSGERVEVLERQEDRAHIRLDSGQEGWIKSSYLSAEPPLRQKLEEREQELSRIKDEKAAMQNELTAAKGELTMLQSELADARRQTARESRAPAVGPAPAPSAPPDAGAATLAADPPGAHSAASPVTSTGAPDPAARQRPLLSPAGLELRPRWRWLAATALVALAAGFLLGWRVLDRRIRKRYGGLRIY